MEPFLNSHASFTQAAQSAVLSFAAKAVCFKEAMEPEFVEYQQQILNNAKRMSASLIERIRLDVV